MKPCRFTRAGRKDLVWISWKRSETPSARFRGIQRSGPRTSRAGFASCLPNASLTSSSIWNCPTLFGSSPSRMAADDPTIGARGGAHDWQCCGNRGQNPPYLSDELKPVSSWMLATAPAFQKTLQLQSRKTLRYKIPGKHHCLPRYCQADGCLPKLCHAFALPYFNRRLRSFHRLGRALRR